MQMTGSRYLQHEVQKQKEIGVRYGGLKFDSLDQLEYDSSPEEVFVPVPREPSVTEVAQIRQVAVFQRAVLYSVTQYLGERVQHALRTYPLALTFDLNVSRIRGVLSDL